MCRHHRRRPDNSDTAGTGVATAGTHTGGQPHTGTSSAPSLVGEPRLGMKGHPFVVHHPRLGRWEQLAAERVTCRRPTARAPFCQGSDDNSPQRAGACRDSLSHLLLYDIFTPPFLSQDPKAAYVTLKYNTITMDCKQPNSPSSKHPTPKETS